MGFAPWLADGIANSGGLTMTKRKAHKLHEKAGWIGKRIEESPYAILNHKWIYMFGDSTTRQVWASFAAPFQGNDFERNAKEYARQYCTPQPNRRRHEKDGHFPEEGWMGPCGVNEKTCHVSGYGENGLLSLDWKHFPYEDYDEYLWSKNGPWISGFPGEGSRRPDYLTVQLGMHSCWHADPQGLYSKNLHAVNQTMLQQHLDDIPKLMKAIFKAVTHPVRNDLPPNGAGKVTQPTTVVIVTSGGVGMFEKGSSIDECILRFNRATVEAAHAHGFAVLERGEIEHRLMFKSYYSAKPFLKNEMHLPQPAQNLVATTLLNLMTCLNDTYAQYDMRSIVEQKTVERHRATPPARPLHVPPS